ncbi:MAG: winged helix-turn-helix domain-containing protein [Phenylobacterium sp.]|nr:winged helix-turn-helix domain-containing protein [Phenylobacterium sp.]
MSTSGGFAGPQRGGLSPDNQIRLAGEPPMRLGPLYIDPPLRRITHDDGRVELLQPRVMQVLTALVHADGKILSRDDLLISCWRGAVVGEDAIDRVIGRVRRLAEGIGAGAFQVTTVPKVGYRLEQAPEAPGVAPGPSICVLPFANMSGDPQQGYFGDGISEDIITDLSKISSLFVVARTTSFALRDTALDVPQIGRRLKVEHVLEGSVRLAGERVRVTAQLIDVRTGGHVWAERYDRLLDDVFTVQDDISQAVVGVLKLKLLPAERAAMEQGGRRERRVLAIGPVLGLSDQLGGAVLEPLRAALAQRLAGEVVLAPQLAETEAERFGFSLDVVFHSAPEAAQAAFVLRQRGGRGAVATFHESIETQAPQGAIDAVAGGVAEAIWRRLALGPQGPAAPRDPPLHIRLDDASELLDPPGAAWTVNRSQFARLRAADPADPRLGLMWALNEFGRRSVHPGPEPLRRESVLALNDEVERLALASLPAVRDDPMLTLAAAELLLGVNRGHEDLAESLARAALASSAAFAAAIPLLGQINAFRGRLDEACRLYDEGLRLCDPGATLELYILVMKAQALIAMEDHAGVVAVFQRAVAIRPKLPRQVGLCFLPVDEGGLAETLAPVAAEADLQQAQRAIAYLHYCIAPNFGTARHAANIMRGPLTQLSRRFGAEVASDEIWREMPAELLPIRDAARRAPPASAEPRPGSGET